jgi:aspartate kinase
VVGVASERGLVLLSVTGGVRDLGAVLELLDARGTSGKEVVLRGAAGEEPRGSLLLSLENIHDFAALRADLLSRCGDAVRQREGLGAVSAIGAGINARFENLRRALDALAAAGVEVLGVSTSSFRISLVIEETGVEEAARRLHAALIEETSASQRPAASS